MKKRRRTVPNLPEKANKILNGILVVLILVGIKVWHLAVIQHEKKQEESKKPQRRVVIERSERATICDRFNIPLATNKVQYNAAISYGPIREIPRSTWKKNEEGKRVRYLSRKEYITKLSQKLADELHMDGEAIEDLIYSKAAILGNVPCILKENISELQYFRLKMLEKDWPGIHAEVAAKRCYPMGPIGGEVIGYIGPISRKEYDSITQEMASLREALNAYEEGESDIDVEGFHTIEEVSQRLEELEKKAYHINDFVGKAGVEASYDEALRGFCGKHIYHADIRGNYLSELPGSHDPIPGNRLVLTISSELQAYAQQLLAEYDSEPFSEASALEKRRTLIPEKQPWIKGGAIVAMNPKTGEIYALASHPSFDPNDFIRGAGSADLTEKKYRVERWLETEGYLAHVWDMKTPFARSRFDEDYYEETLELGWEEYLQFVLPKCSPIREVLKRKNHLADAIWTQRVAQKLIAYFKSDTLSLEPAKLFDCLFQGGEHIPSGVLITLQEREFFESQMDRVAESVSVLLKALDPYFKGLSRNYEKLLLLDMYRLVIDEESISPLLADLLDEMPIAEFREACARYVCVRDVLLGLVKDLFYENDFKKWRQEHSKAYLAEKRKIEKETNQKYARPYTEYLEEVRKEMFAAFWENYQWDLITLFLTGETALTAESLSPYLSSLKTWATELKAGAHQGLDWSFHYNRLCLVTDQLESTLLVDFLKTLRSFEQLSRPLWGKYTGLRGNKEKHLAAAFYPTYGFGFARSQSFRQATTIGSIFKLVPAYEALRQRYMACTERGETCFDLNPFSIIDDKHRVWGKSEAWNVGYTLDGKPIPLFYRGGRLPRSDHAGVGKVDLIRALEVSSNPYFAMLVGDHLEDPEDLCVAANLLGYGEKTTIDLPGEYAGRIPVDVSYNRTGLYSMSIGQHSLVGTPLQTALMLSAVANGGEILKPQIVKEMVTQAGAEEKHPEVRWRVFMPPQIQNMLLAGLRQVVMGSKGTARELCRHYDSQFINQIVGKTSTSEVVEKMSLDGAEGRMKLTHVWFGAISYESADFSRPDLVVIVYLRFGEWGRHAAPLAVEMVKKWREVQDKHKKFGIGFAHR